MGKWQILLMVVGATLCVSIGEALLSVGMKQVAKANVSGLVYVIAAATNARVLLGTALMAAFFAIYAVTLSEADFSFVLPLTALSFLFGAIIAHFYLAETVTTTRWIGTLVIMVGVAVVVFGEKQNPQPRKCLLSNGWPASSVPVQRAIKRRRWLGRCAGELRSVTFL
jgi:drug/metabolite transporter (DMT)-like permease